MAGEVATGLAHSEHSSAAAMWLICRRLNGSLMEPRPQNFPAARKLPPVGTRCWSNPGAPLIEFTVTQLTFSLLERPSGISRSI